MSAPARLTAACAYVRAVLRGYGQPADAENERFVARVAREALAAGIAPPSPHAAPSSSVAHRLRPQPHAAGNRTSVSSPTTNSGGVARAASPLLAGDAP
jgi:hypothetical protein